MSLIPSIISSDTTGRNNGELKGTWNAATNTPTLTNPPTSINYNIGDYYRVTDAGSQFGFNFEVGDAIVVVSAGGGVLAWDQDTNIVVPVRVQDGGTGGTTAGAARVNLGVGAVGVLNSLNNQIHTTNIIDIATDSATNEQVLQYNTTRGKYEPTTLPAGGDVTGPASSTDSNVALFDGTTGKIIKDGGTTITAINSSIATKLDEANSIYRSNYAKYCVDGRDDFATVINSITNEGTIVNLSSGSFGGATPLTINKDNIAIFGPPSTPGLVEFLYEITTASTADRIRMRYIMFDADFTAAAKRSTYNHCSFTENLDIETSATPGYMTFANCGFEAGKTISVQNTYASAVYFINCNFNGCSFALNQASSTQVIFSNCGGFTSFPTNATYAGINTLTSGFIQNTVTKTLLATGAGTSGQVLTSGGAGLPDTWVTPSSSSGDVAGPASSTDENIASFDGTTGKIIQDGGITTSAISSTISQTNTNTTDIAANTSSIGTNTTDIATNVAAIATKISASSTDTLTNKTLTAPIISGLELSDSSIIFEGATTDNNETTLSVEDPTVDRTITLPDQSGRIPLLSNNSNDLITAVPIEINILDGVTASTAEINILDGVTATTAEINILDGNTTGSSLTLVDSNQIIVNDNGTMAQTALSDVSTYLSTATQTLTNKTIDADGTGNSITNIENANIKSGAAIDASKLADGTVSNTELQYINSLISNAQDQIDAKGSGTVTSITAGTGLDGGTITGSGTIDLADTAVSAGAYTSADITIDAQGRITSASNGSGGGGGVTSITAGDGLSGGTITGSGTIGLDFVQEVTGSGSVTAPANAKYVKVIAHGGGGGGGGSGFSIFDIDDGYSGGGGGGGGSGSQQEASVTVKGGSSVLYYDCGSGGSAGAGQGAGSSSTSGGAGVGTTVSFDASGMETLAFGSGGGGGGGATIGTSSGVEEDAGSGGSGAIGGGGGQRGSYQTSGATTYGTNGSGGGGTPAGGDGTNTTSGAGGFNPGSGVASSSSPGGGGGGPDGGSAGIYVSGGAGTRGSGGAGGSSPSGASGFTAGKGGGAGGAGYALFIWYY